MVSLNSLRISRRHIRAGARRLGRRRRRRSNKAVLLPRELRVWCIAVDSAVSLLTRALATGRILWLALDVVVGHIPVSLLFIVDLLVGRIW